MAYIDTMKRAGEIVRVVLDELFFRIRVAGRGTLSRLQRQMGVSDQYFYNWKRSDKGVEGIPFFQISKAIELLGLDPEDFFRSAFEPTRSTPLERAASPVVRRLRSPGPESSVEPMLSCEELEEMRLSEPRRALQILEEQIASLEPDVVASFLAVAGSAHRMVVELPQAVDCIDEGLRLARDRADHAVLGDLLQRRAYVLADFGNYAEALQEIDRSILEYVYAGGDRLVLAQRTVDRGHMLYYMKEFDQAEMVWLAALRNLPMEGRKHRYAALHGLGMIANEQGEREKALVYLEKAAEEAEGMAPYIVASVFWLKGRIAFEGGDFELSSREFRRTLDLYLPDPENLDVPHTSPGQAALVGVELVRSLFCAGDLMAARDTARQLTNIAARLWRNTIVCEALKSLIFTEKLTHSLIESTLVQITGALERTKDSGEKKDLAVSARSKQASQLQCEEVSRSARPAAPVSPWRSTEGDSTPQSAPVSHLWN